MQVNEGIRQEATVKIGTLNPQSTANTRQSHGTTDFKGVRLLHSVVTVIAAAVRTFNVQATSNASWMALRPGFIDEFVLDCPAAVVLNKVDESDAQAVSNAARMHRKLDSLQELVTAAGRVNAPWRLVYEFTTQETANVCWRLIKLWCGDCFLLDWTLCQVAPRTSESNCQEPSIAEWESVTAASRQKPSTGKTTAEPVSCVSTFGLLEISNTGWPLATMKIRSGATIGALSVAGLLGVSEVSSDGSSPGHYSLAWSNWKFVRPSLLHALFKRAPPSEPMVHGLMIMDHDWSKDSRLVQGLDIFDAGFQNLLN